MTLQELLTKNPDKAMQLFDMVNDLASQQPNSQIARDWNTTLQSVGLNDIIEAYGNQDEPDRKKGYEGWEDYFRQMYGKNANPMNFAVNKLILPTVGTGIQAAGNMLNARHSILGGALAAMAPSIKPSSEYDRSGIPEMTAAMLGMQGAKKIASGAVIKAGTDALGGAVKQIGNELEARNEKARESALMMNEHPVGDFYRDSMQIRKNAQNLNK